MATTANAEDAPPASAQEKWDGNEEGDQNSKMDLEPLSNGERETAPAENGTAPDNGGEEPRSGGVDQDGKEDYRSSAPATESGGNPSSTHPEKRMKPNKVYVGGLPEHTRQEDLQNCFGKIGDIVNIELKLGYGFVEFETKEAAEESVAKYHEGYFMGNKIRVEISRGGSRGQKHSGEPGACFKCGSHGHWARECPNPAQIAPRKSTHHSGHNQDHGERSYQSRDYPSKEYPAYSREIRDTEPSRYPPARSEPRYGYDYPPQAAPAPSGRDYRRPASPPPPREYRDYPAPPRRDYDDYRVRTPAPAPPSRGYYPPELPSNYPPRAYEAAPPPREYLDRGSDRRLPPTDRYAQYPPSSRPRTPPPPVRSRDEYERLPPRDYPPPDYRGRPVTPPLPTSSGSRYGDYPTRNVDHRYRRRSQSPPLRSGYRGGYANDHIDPGYASYSTSSAPYPSNGYGGSSGAPHRRDRDYPPPRGVSDVGGYSRRG